jgi:hypothetical protein
VDTECAGTAAASLRGVNHNEVSAAGAKNRREIRLLGVDEKKSSFLAGPSREAEGGNYGPCNVRLGDCFVVVRAHDLPGALMPVATVVTASVYAEERVPAICGSVAA